MDAKSLEAMLGAASNLPKDSEVGKALAFFVEALKADAKGDGKCGAACRAMMLAATNRNDALYKVKGLGVLERESVVALAEMGLKSLDG